MTEDTFCVYCLRDDCVCGDVERDDTWLLQKSLRPPEVPGERPTKVTVLLDGTRYVTCSTCGRDWDTLDPCALCNASRSVYSLMLP